MEAFMQAVAIVIDPFTLLVILVSAVFGLFVGAIPGLTATMATALLVPLTFFMAPVPAIAAIISCTAMAIAAGDIPAVLLRMPGTPASAAYTDEGYAMARQGRGGYALGILFVSSVIGGLFGFIALALIAPALARVALNFSSFEYVWLALLGLSCAALVSAADPLKGFLSLLIGLFVATIGMDPLTGFARFTFGSTELQGGIDFIPAMIGMFAVAEILRRWKDQPYERAAAPPKHPYAGTLAAMWQYRWPLMRGNVLGTVVGALPGAGGDIAAWISYAVSKRLSKTPEKFGTGHPEGLVESGASNNSGLTGAWIPAMVFGIPGDTITAIAIGILYMKGLNPGPTLLTQNPQNFYAELNVFLIANLLILPIGWVAIRGAEYLFRLPRSYLNSGILVFSVVGAFAVTNSSTAILVMLVFGVLAFVLEAKGFPVAPIILGIVLGPILEQNFIASMTIANGDLLGFFSRPVSAGLGVLTIAIWLLPLVLKLRRRMSRARVGVTHP
jgi:putative tricarboxylic transport membrane protein